MTRQKKEIFRKIENLERGIMADKAMGYGFAPTGAYDETEREIERLREELARIDDDACKRLDVIEVCGVRGLFSNSRIPADALPDGAYKYDIRHGDDGYFCTIEKSVVVNHAGTVLTKEPLDFGGSDYIVLEGDDAPNFLCETATIAEFFSRADA